jgi:hypothetical protein
MFGEASVNLSLVKFEDVGSDKVTEYPEQDDDYNDEMHVRLRRVMAVPRGARLTVVDEPPTEGTVSGVPCPVLLTQQMSGHLF